jgi:hypothetical protein
MRMGRKRRRNFTSTIAPLITRKEKFLVEKLELIEES